MKRTSAIAVAVAAALTGSHAFAQAAPFGSMVAMQNGMVRLPNGQMSKWTGANRPVVGTDTDGRPLMTIEQTEQKALLDWERFELQADEILEFQQQRADWIAVNRVHSDSPSRIDGEIRAIGRVFILNDNGVLMGEGAKINTRQLVTGRGVSDVLVDGATTTIVQSKDKAILNWSDLSTQAGEVLKFQQEKQDWIVLNRSLLEGRATQLKGDIKADGHVVLVAREGLSIEGKVEAQQVIASSLEVRDSQFLSTRGLTSAPDNYNDRNDPTFSNTWKYNTDPQWNQGWLYADDPPPPANDPNDPLRYAVTVGSTGRIETASRGKVMLIGPNVNNRGRIRVQDEGQVLLAAGDNIYLIGGPNGVVNAYSGAYNPMSYMRANIPYSYPSWRSDGIVTAEWVDFINHMTAGTEIGAFAVGDVLTFEQVSAIVNRIVPYINEQQARRVADVGFHARNEGIITASRGGRVDFRGWNLEQMGSIEMTSTAAFRGAISFTPVMYDYQEYANNSENGPMAPGNGNVVFGRGSLTQITPDLDATDTIPVSEGAQSVGSLTINARSVHMQEDAVIYMPSGSMNVLLDAGAHVFSNRGAGMNADNEDGTRFMMDRGATIDLSGWETTLGMGYHQVTGKLYAAQLADSPLQRDGALYRQEISVDRRFGTNIADWQSFDNLSQGTLAQFLINGGKLTMDIGDDFIMKSGSVIDVSGGKITYQDGFVYTSLLRRLDGSLIDIREANPDELYMGLANSWTDYDTKWNTQRTYYIPLMSSVQGRYETSYEQGGNAGRIDVLAPDTVLQGSLLGSTTIGRYQRTNRPTAGVFELNNAGESEKEYVSNNILITAAEHVLADSFGMYDMLSDTYGDLFGKEFDPETDRPAMNGRLFDNTTLTSADFFQRSSMGSYSFDQDGRIDPNLPPVNNAFVPVDGPAVVIEKGAQLNLANGASLSIAAGQRMEFLGSVRTEGGDISLSGMSLRFGESSVLDTRGSWYSDYELDEPVALSSVPRIDGGSISLSAGGSDASFGDQTLTLPATMIIDASGGAWVDRNGNVKAGKGGDLGVVVGTVPEFDLSGLDSARAYGLGGNGKFSISVTRNIHVGTELPAVVAGEEAELGAVLFRPEFFENSGFSAISLSSAGGTVTLQEGVQINATSASLQLDQSTLSNGVLSAYYAPSGTDIYDIATPRYLTPEQRPAGLRNGMTIELNGAAIGINEGSLLGTEAGGSLSLSAGLVDVYGTLSAPAGKIALSGGTINGTVLVHDTARLLAPGAVRILNRGIDSSGRELLDGEVLNGGTIALDAATLKIERGAVLDVSGTSAVFDLAQSASGATVRQPRTVASDGGSISVSGQALDVNDATFLAHSGGAGARGGNFSFAWAGGYSLQRDPGAPTPDTVYDYFGFYFEFAYLNDLNGNPITSFFGTDLSQVDWNIFGQVYDFHFPPGFTINSREELVAMLKAYDAAVLGAAPMLLVGDNLPDTGGGAGPQPPTIEPALRALLEQLGNYTFLPVPESRPSPVTRLSPATIMAGGFANLNISASPGIVFAGDATLGGRRADGSATFDTIKLNAPRIMGQSGANVNINADVVTLSSDAQGLPVDQAMYDTALAEIGVNPVNENTHLHIAADKLLQIDSAEFYGYSDTQLSSGGDIRLIGTAVGDGLPPSGFIHSAGKLIFKADQLYAATGRKYEIKSDDTIEILPQDAGTPINASPYEAGAELTLTAPRIVQGGTIRSPLGTINLVGIEDGSEGANTITLLPGSLTSVSGDGKVIPYGVTASGDTWIDPITGLELTALPSKSVNLTAETLDMQQGAVLDVKGGGDLYASEFTPGIGGTKDWTTGYRDGNYQWVADASNVFAVIPDYDADIAPIGMGSAGSAAIGERIWLSGGSGLPEGYYTLLPARYALLPGAFRVTANHHYGDHGDMVPGQSTALLDGSSIQAGYRFMPNADGSPRYTAQRTDGYLVMPGATLRERSQYVETRANTFYLSDAFLKKALRTNRPVGEVPRIPLDGGSVVLDASGSITLDATLRSAAAEGGRGGFADIKGEKILVAGAGTDLSLYDDYLVLDSDRLNSFGAESLLLGGVRKQGAVNVEIDVGATDIVIDNAGSVLAGPELLFASGGDITVKAGSALETRGTISGSSGDLRMRPSIAAYSDEAGTPGYPYDDIVVNGDLDQGSVLRLSSSEQVDILRNINAVDALGQLFANPAALAAVNDLRVAAGLDPITQRGSLLIEDGARLTSSRSLALDATNDTRLAPGASVSTRQISASASRVSVGEVPAGTSGLVFAGGSLGALASAEDIMLKSYSSIDFYGSATLRADGALSLDGRQINAVNADGGTVTIAGKSLTLTNTNGGTSTATAGTARLLLEGDNIYLAGGDKWLSGVGTVDIQAGERVIGRDENTLYVPAALNIQAADVTADSGARLFFDAQGDVTINNNGNTHLPEFQTLGATLGVTGANVVNQGRVGLTGGTINLRARSGNVTLVEGSSIDVTSNTSQIFDVEVGVAGGTVNLTSDHGNIDMKDGATIDISGTSAGGDAGTLHASAAEGEVLLAGNVLGKANEGYRSGSFSSLSRSISDFTGLNAQLDLGGFRQSRRFEVNEGDINVSSTVSVQEFAAVANQGSINVEGTIATVGDNGGRIQLSAARNVTLSSTGRLTARANASDGSGGTVFLETTGENGGRINIASGSQIDVSGTGEGGRVVRLRAPQLGGDVAIDAVAGTILGARSVIAEGFRVYDGVHTIDQGVIDTVSADASAFMANAAAIQSRLGSGVTVAPGIELRSDSDMELVQDWDLHDLRFGTDQSAGVLTLRAAGDLLINGNLSDGFDGSTADANLLGGNSWTLNLTAGANTTSPDSLAVLPVGQLANGKGSIIVGGTPDTIEYYKIQIDSGPLAGTIEHRLYLKDGNGNLVTVAGGPPPGRYQELSRDDATGLYIDPFTGELIQKDPVTGDYIETARYGKAALPELYSEGMYSTMLDQFGNYEAAQITQFGQSRSVQWDNSTGYMVRTGTSGINIASGRDIVLQYAPSVIYTAGQSAAPIADFQAPTRLPLYAPGDLWSPMTGYYLEGGGDLLLRAQGNVIGASSDQLPNAWLWRYGVDDQATGDFRALGTQSLGRDYEQTTWFVRFDKYQAGIGALGGGNVDISAGGDVNNVTVNMPNTGRVSGGFNGIERVLHTSGGGDLSVRAGGNIGSGIFYVAEGKAQLSAGGSFNSSRQVMAVRQGTFGQLALKGYDLYTTLLTSSGDFHLQSGGDLNIDAVLDPMNLEQAQNNKNGGGGNFGPENIQQYVGDDRLRELYGLSFVSYTPEAKVDLFSAGGDVNIWNNQGNLSLLQWRGSFMQPQHYFITEGSPGVSIGGGVSTIWPATLSAVAAAGNVVVKGGMYMAPAPKGNLTLLAKQNVLFGQGSRVDDPFAELNRDAQNYFPGYEDIFMSQSRMDALPDATNIRQTYGQIIDPNALVQAGATEGFILQSQGWDELHVPDLHVGDTTPARIYAAEGDVVTTKQINVPKQLWVQAGRHVYFPYYTIQHNSEQDLSLVRAGDGLYFSGDGYVNVFGPGRLEIETGKDFWVPSNARGVTSNRIAFTDPDPYDLTPGAAWHPNQAAADTAISTGYNQKPNYEAFENAYLNPEMAAEIHDYLLADAGDGRELPIYLFDRIYARGNGSDSMFASPELAAGFVNYIRGMQGLPPLAAAADQAAYLNQAWDFWMALPTTQTTAYDGLVPRMTVAEAKARGAKPEFYQPERREGLVNYVRRLQGLDALKTQEEQLAYLDTAWAYWNTLTTDFKTPLYRNTFFMELRTTGREVNDPDNDRYNTTFRGYDAIATLFPGAQKRDDEALSEGESRWAGDFETFASRVVSNGGGKVEYVIPGGGFKLANVSASPDQTGQPTSSFDRGNALRAGVITQDGGDINIFSKSSVTVNNSRILTTKGGNVMIWSSYGDIAAGKGAKTSITPQFYDYSLGNWLHMSRVPAGLPTGAGIGTLATQPGVPAADVDLIAPNGIVDAGDAGLRVSGNFNVFAVQILGTDNIDVQGVSTGLPVPPAAPPTSLNIDDAAAKATKVTGALLDSLKQVQDNAAIKAPSIIEVKVLGYGEECAEDRKDCQSEQESKK